MADIYYVLFRQKLVIIAFSIMGVMAAGALYFLKPARYESQAGLYIQYIKDQTPLKPSSGDDGSYITPLGQNASGVITSELEILSSQELSRQVVSIVGADRILAKCGGGNDTNAAVAVIQKGLMPDPVPKGSVVRIAFQHPDKAIAEAVLGAVLNCYVIRSADMHRPVSLSAEYLQEQTYKLKENLEKTEGELRTAYEKAGIVSSLDETKKDLNNQIDEAIRDLNRAETQLAGHEAPLKVAGNVPTATSPATNAAPQIDPRILKNYQDICDLLSQAETAFKAERLNAPDGSPLLDGPRRKVENFEAQKLNLEKQYPALTNMPVAIAKSSGQSGTYLDLAYEANEVVKLRATTNMLRSQLDRMKEQQRRISAVEPEIQGLLHRQKLQKDTVDLFVKSSIDNAVMANSKGDGIKINEPPTAAVQTRSKKFKKMVMMALGGGFGGGIALAFLIEMVLDRSVRRPSEVEAKLGLPLFISIPDFERNGHHKQAQLQESNRLLLKSSNTEALVHVGHGENGANGKGNGNGNGHGGEMHPYFEGLRDRLIVNFEVRNLTHNPKLVGVTSCSKGAGVSSIAAGLAASLSETGDGNVLLVDMRGKQGSAQHFHKGKPGCGLDAALESETRDTAFIRENLYVASEGPGENNSARSLPKRFATLMPKLKASDYDYVIFDMPPVSQTSMTPRLSGLMDMTLLVIESETTTRDSVQKATKLLAESKASVSTVLNKVHSYVPQLLHSELLDDV